jgi:type II secretory ATPase GspE/PulE/Tfp pilus assembly ATPase PilB-like protein
MMSSTPPAAPFVASSDAPETVADLLRRATTAQASDIHLQRQGAIAQVAFRLDGVLVPVGELPPGLADRVFGRIKYLAHLKTYVDDLPQEGRLEPDAANATGDIRVSTYPTVTGEKMVLRLFTTRATQNLDGLDLSSPATTALRRVLAQPSGLLLLTGPAGSGKTSTIYASLRALAEAGRHVITVEDPVEQILPGVMQTEINEPRGITFASAARHLLRQDPEVLALGEIRDEETAGIALRAALTGHLLISTLHAGSCRGVFDRLLLLGIDASSLGALNGLILNQRLLRRRCPVCRGEGCLECLNTGYRGRVPLVEWLTLDEPVRRALHQGSLEGLAPEVPLAVQAERLVASGITDQREVQRVLGHES